MFDKHIIDRQMMNIEVLNMDLISGPRDPEIDLDGRGQ